MKQCPRCASEITSKMKKCDRCGLPLDSVDFSDEIVEEEKRESAAQKKREQKAAKKAEKKAKKQELKEKKKQEAVSNTDFSKFATNSGVEEPVDNLPKSKRARKKAKLERPVFEIDENGEFNIDTDDVEIVGKETGKLIEEQYTKTYSVKKARGDYKPPKIKWWEIYKLADRAFARRKIKKEVNKAAKYKPDFVSKGKLLALSIFLGWCGAHNFYAKNKKKGWFQVVTLFLWLGVTFLSMRVAFFAKISLSVGGCAGFLDVFTWFSDIIAIMFNSFKYRVQKEAFIFKMNVETRAKLGEKYIDLDLYKKPWWVRFKVWCQKKKRGYEEWKHDHRQAMIEREKIKLAKKEEKEKIEAEIARHEAKENEELEKSKEERNLDAVKESIKEIKALDDEAVEKPAEEKMKKTQKPKQTAKVSVKTKKSNNNKSKKK